MKFNMNRNFIFHGLISWSILGASCLWADGTESVTNSGNTYVAEKSPSWWRTLAVPKVTDGAETNGSNVNLGTLATGDQFQASALELRVQKDSKFVTELSNKVAAEKFPNWGLMLKTGLFKPSTSDWDSHYEDHSVFQYGVGASYRIWNGIHLKTEVEQWNVKGKGTLNTGGLGSELKYQVRPYRLGLSYEYARSSLSMVRPFNPNEAR